MVEIQDIIAEIKRMDSANYHLSQMVIDQSRVIKSLLKEIEDLKTPPKEWTFNVHEDYHQVDTEDGPGLKKYQTVVATNRAGYRFIYSEPMEKPEVYCSMWNKECVFNPDNHYKWNPFPPLYGSKAWGEEQRYEHLDRDRD